MGKPKPFASVTLTSIAVTEICVLVWPFTGPDCSFNMTKPKPGSVILVLGGGVPETGTPKTTRLVNVELLVLVALELVAVLDAIASTSSAVIVPDSTLTF